MKLGSHRDYSGSRSYAPDLPPAQGGWLSRLSGRLAAWTMQKLELSLRSGAEQPSEMMWLIHGKDRHFSLLGAEYDRKTRRAASPCPFPEGDVRTRRPIRDRSAVE
jgi:hypothetical protein